MTRAVRAVGALLPLVGATYLGTRGVVASTDAPVRAARTGRATRALATAGRVGGRDGPMVVGVAAGAVAREPARSLHGYPPPVGRGSRGWPGEAWRLVGVATSGAIAIDPARAVDGCPTRAATY